MATDPTERKLRKLQSTSLEKGRFPLAAACGDLIEHPDELDRRINLLGAAHEAGLLKNSLALLWAEWRTDEAAWLDRCLARLTTPDRDHDHWAVAAMLGCDAKLALQAAQRAGLEIFSLRHAERFDKPALHIASLSLPSKLDRIRSCVVELGWDVKTHELVDCARMRAVLWDSVSVVSDSEVGTGTMSCFLRSQLPYGSWRNPQDLFEIKAEWVVPRAASIAA